jgi:hypothetical protein
MRALVLAARDGDELIRHLEDRVAGYQRGRVAVGAEAEMEQVDRGGQLAGVVAGAALRIGSVDRQGMDLYRLVVYQVDCRIRSSSGMT